MQNFELTADTGTWQCFNLSIHVIKSTIKPLYETRRGLI